MRNISFSMLTTAQMRAQTKDVTRRMGWLNLKKGDLLCAVVKGMGLKPGEKIERICVIRVDDVRREKLSRMMEDSAYGFEEVRREGFKDDPVKGWPSQFVEFFCAGHGCTPDDEITRIEFSYADEVSLPGEKK
jgi:hypothetical protein